MEIGILSYGLGNVKAFLNAYDYLQIPCSIIDNPIKMNHCKRLILPGVGAFDNAVQKLKNRGFWDVLNEQVLIKKKPILGVCIGMQIMGLKSEEGLEIGFNWFENAIITKFQKSRRFRTPHIGWNKVQLESKNLLFSELNNKEFYFLHSFRFNSQNNENCIGKTEYNEMFCSVIAKENIYGVQFHPEKSHENGYKLLHNFSKV